MTKAKREEPTVGKSVSSSEGIVDYEEKDETADGVSTEVRSMRS